MSDLNHLVLDMSDLNHLVLDVSDLVLAKRQSITLFFKRFLEMSYIGEQCLL